MTCQFLRYLHLNAKCGLRTKLHERYLRETASAKIVHNDLREVNFIYWRLYAVPSDVQLRDVNRIAKQHTNGESANSNRLLSRREVAMYTESIVVCGEVFFATDVLFHTPVICVVL